MTHEVNIAVRIALIQVLVVIIGVFMTRLAFTFGGYPDSDKDWNSLSLFIRNYGFLILLLPVAWTTVVVFLENRGSGHWSRPWTIGTGLFVLFALAALFLWSDLHPFHFHSSPMQSW